MELSIVTTMYCSAPYIEEFYRRISTSAEKITKDYEIIFVNDGSPDDSLKIAVGLHENDPRVKVIELSRNFGHHKAIMTGLGHAEGNLVFLIDSDLEEEPELLEQFFAELNSDESVDVLYGVQNKRKGSLYERISGAIFYRLINFLSDWSVPTNVTTVRLMKRHYVENLLKFSDNEIFFIGICVLTGFNQKPVPIDKHDKHSSTYTIRKKVVNLVNAVTSFSSRPLAYIFYTGSFVIVLALAYSVYILYRKLFLGVPVPGYTSILISVWFFGGVTIFALGLIGMYIAKIFSETKNRPYTIIKKVYGNKAVTDID